MEVKHWEQRVVGSFGSFAHPVLTAERIIIILNIICTFSAAKLGIISNPVLCFQR